MEFCFGNFNAGGFSSFEPLAMQQLWLCGKNRFFCRTSAYLSLEIHRTRNRLEVTHKRFRVGPRISPMNCPYAPPSDGVRFLISSLQGFKESRGSVVHHCSSLCRVGSSLLNILSTPPILYLFTQRRRVQFEETCAPLSRTSVETTLQGAPASASAFCTKELQQADAAQASGSTKLAT